MKRKTIPLQTMLLTKFTVRHFVFKLVFNSNLGTMPDIIYTNFVLSVNIFNDLSYNVHKWSIRQRYAAITSACKQQRALCQLYVTPFLPHVLYNYATPQFAVTVTVTFLYNQRHQKYQNKKQLVFALRIHMFNISRNLFLEFTNGIQKQNLYFQHKEQDWFGCMFAFQVQDSFLMVYVGKMR